MQGDPLIQAPNELQSFNRFSYCMNAVLNCTDPSGYSWLSKAWKKVWNNKAFRTIAVVVISIYLPGAEGLLATQMGVTNVVANAAITGFAGGAVATGTMKGAIQGAFSAGLFAGVGNVISGVDAAGGTFRDVDAAKLWGAGIADKGSQIALHGVAGCVSSAAGGGKCGEGALSAAFSKMATVNGLVGGDQITGAITSAIVGGTASALGGGSFANGARTAAMGYLFNCVAHKCWMLPNDSEASYYRYGTPGSGAGQYAQAGALSVIFEVESAWSAIDSRSIGIGNISLEGGGPFPPHGTHQQGLEFDVRPLRTDGARAQVTWYDAAYDRAATQRLVDTLRATRQVDRILFNDPNIKGVTPYIGHDNHLHVKVKPPGR